MHTDAGILNSSSPAAHRAANAPASSTRQRAGERPSYVPLPGEEATAIRAAESFLTDFCAVGIESLPWRLRPAAIKYAIGHLVTLALSNETVADVFVEAVAAAAGVTKTGLQKVIQERCWFFKNLPRLHGNRDTRQQAIAELERILTA